jgi:sulfate/thiosulfate transport system ATP-binding protein
VGIAVHQVCKRFGAFVALDHVSVEIKTGSLVALLGPSGSGKSTLLRAIAGLEPPDSGQIFLTGRDATHETVQDRQVGFVFQHYALFKHMTVRKNIAFGLEISKNAKSRIKQRVEQLLELVQLAGLGDRYPSQLSGGQRQRVALARALAVEPKVLLLDEPFGALDAKVRKDLRNWLRRLHDEVHVTTVFVTHDQEEAMEISDEIVVMNRGQIEQVGTPAEIYDHPETPFVIQFIGPVNVLPSTADIFRNSKTHAHCAELFLRPHDVMISLESETGSVPATVSRLIHLGWEVQVELLLEDNQGLICHLSRQQFNQLNVTLQQSVFVKPKQIRSFEPEYSI